MPDDIFMQNFPCKSIQFYCVNRIFHYIFDEIFNVFLSDEIILMRYIRIGQKYGRMVRYGYMDQVEIVCDTYLLICFRNLRNFRFCERSLSSSSSSLQKISLSFFRFCLCSHGNFLFFISSFLLSFFSPLSFWEYFVLVSLPHCTNVEKWKYSKSCEIRPIQRKKRRKKKYEMK